MVPVDQLFHKPELLACTLQSITMFHAAPSAIAIVLETTQLPPSLRCSHPAALAATDQYCRWVSMGGEILTTAQASRLLQSMPSKVPQTAHSLIVCLQ